MTPLALALVLVAAFAHAGWNALAKRAPGGATFVWTQMVVGSVCMVPVAAVGIWLWAEGTVGAGVVATALPLAWQIANVAGWVSWEVTGIFENIGVVQEGMQTIAVPHSGIDRPGARKVAISYRKVTRRNPVRIPIRISQKSAWCIPAAELAAGAGSA